MSGTGQRALVHLLNGNVDAARAIFFVSGRHRQLVSDSLALAAANPSAMQSAFVRKHVGKKRLKFLADHQAAYSVSPNCNCRTPNRAEFRQMSPSEVNSFLASRGLDVRVRDG